MESILAFKNSLQFLRYLYACGNQVFFYFSKHLSNYKEFSKSLGLFSSPAKYYFLQKVRYIQWNLLNLSSLVCNNFSKNSWFLSFDKSQVQKSGDVIICFFCIGKKQIFRSIQTHSCTPLFTVLSFSKCLVCFIYLLHFYQHYFCFTRRTCLYVCETHSQVVLILRYQVLTYIDSLCH